MIGMHLIMPWSTSRFQCEVKVAGVAVAVDIPNLRLTRQRNRMKPYQSRQACHKPVGF